MIVKLPDGKVLELENGANGLAAAGAIGRGLLKAALAIKVNGELRSLQESLCDGDEISIITAKDEEALGIIRHTGSHILAQAVLHVFPDANVKLGIGPAYAGGFYYDFDLNRSISVEDFDAISKEMDRIIKEDLPIVRSTKSRKDAIAWAKAKEDPYKEELVEAIEEGSEISFYTQGDFTDLCAGPHLPSTGKFKHFKLMSVAGAYWRGDEHNPMMQRIYATAFASKDELDEHLRRLEEAQKRDHRRLGKELDLFSILEEGPGFPFFHPKGMIIMNNLLDFWRKEHTRRGYQEVNTPIILSRQLWERSGHYDHYRDNMYFLKIDEEDFAIKPMNCPGGILMYKRKPVSYRDLPIRMAELGVVHRHELSGALHGLMRVRKFTQDDAHIFMTPEQIKEEILGVLDLTEYFYSVFGFKYFVELSTRPENSMGSDEDWDRATEALKEALEAKGWDYKINEGDGAFYGPKIDIHLEDCIGRTWQCGTIQLDFQLPERFDLTYDGSDGKEHRPIMIHRVVLGSIERFIGILTEHFAGAFPLWLAPVQARVMTITDRAIPAAKAIRDQLMEAGIRVELDERNEKINYKIRQAQLEKIPYMLVLGDREAEEGTVALRKRGDKGNLGVFTAEEVIAKLNEEIKNKTV
ncbi:MAG: threonine--tRNA ligase [Clostridiales bacterium]|nr:threonine--tRNA ligase [Clostridiales bacterium]